MGEWKEYKLGEITAILTGFPFRGEEYAMEGDLKVVRGENVTVGSLRWDTAKYWNHSVEGLEKYSLDESDIVVGMDGSKVGQNRAIIRAHELPLILAQRVARLRAKKGFDQNFVWYHVFNKRFLDYVEAIHTGTSIPHISQAQIGDFELSAPEIKEQNVIGTILSSLDNKIDLLHRQNKTLEALAETLFRQWFVEEAVDLETKILDELIVFDPREKVSSTIEYTFFDMKCLSNSSMAIADGIKRTVNSGSSFRNGDTLLAKITPCLENGKTGFVMNLEEDELVRGSTEFIVMRAKEGVSPYFVYCLARYSDFRNTAILSMTGTSGRQRVQSAVLKDYEIKYSKGAMEKFHSICHLHFLKIRQNLVQIRTLTRLRDTLLPKLMSGEVRVKLPLTPSLTKEGE